ncbi:MAG: hypothetical protein M1827_002303 [Pycnora praestabilis]|nr:MAG: hypothetical protein M1827_002303 [Pycnora praestabilis]
MAKLIDAFATENLIERDQPGVADLVMEACGNLLLTDIWKDTVRPIHYSVNEFFTMHEDLSDHKNKLGESFTHLVDLEVLQGHVKEKLIILLEGESPRLGSVLHIRTRGNLLSWSLCEATVTEFIYSIRLSDLHFVQADANRWLGAEVFQHILHRAAEGSVFSAVIRLVKAGHLINAVDQRGRTPLQCAVSGCRYEVCEWLLDEGADVNADNSTTLQAVALNRNEKVIKLLLEKETDVNIRDVTVLFRFCWEMEQMSVREVARIAVLLVLLVVAGLMLSQTRERRSLLREFGAVDLPEESMEGWEMDEESDTSLAWR